MAADKLTWKTAGTLLLAATHLVLRAWLLVERRLLERGEDRLTRLRRLGAV